MALPAILAGVQAASGIASAIGGFTSGQSQARAANEYARRQYKQRLKIWEQENLNAQEAYATRLQRYNQQVSEFDRAAALGYQREQLRQNEAFQQAMFGTQDRSIQLARLGGQTAARGAAGKSASRLGNEALMAFGRNQAKMAESLYSGQMRYGQNVQDIRNRQQSAVNQAYSQIAIAPKQTIAPIAPLQQSGPSALSMIGDIGSSVVGAAGTYDSLSPEGSKLADLFKR